MVWAPQPGPQTEAISCDWCPELFYGGAAGGGKSDFLLGDFLQDVPTYEKAWQGVLFRRTYPELEELVRRSFEIYPATGADWSEQKKLWTWPNGASLRMRYLERDVDALRYQGHQYTWIGWDELTQWATMYGYRYLRGRLRSAHPVATKRIRSAANPGGAGHLEVKRYFVDPAPTGFVPIHNDETGMDRIFIPARLTDNSVLLQNDPGYAGRLKGLGSETLVRALLDGDWDVIEGAFFDCWDARRHVVKPFAIPDEWLRFRSGDWGSARPFSFGWWAVVSDPYQVGDVVLPRGCMVRYREWYGCQPDKPNTGLKMHAEAVGAKLAEIEKGEKISYGVLDPAAFAEDGGPSIYERIRIGSGNKVIFRPADNKRVAGRGAMGGWDQMRARLVGDDDGNPMVVCFSTCTDSIRTIPALQHDSDKPEDLDSDMEDHASDDWRYACMSRPWVKQKATPKVKTDQSGYRSLETVAPADWQAF